jgi:hypothetical protein
VSNKLATSCTPDRARKSASGSDANIFSADTFVGGGGANTTDTDDVHQCGDAKPSITLTAPSDCSGNCTLTATVTQGTHPLSSDQYPGQVIFSIDGQQVQTFPVSDSPSSISFSYKPTDSGNKTVTATVVDSVLYDASDSASVNFTGSGGGGESGSLDLSIDNLAGNAYQFNWNTVPGADSYQLCIDTDNTPDYVCSAANPGTVKTVSGGKRKAYVVASNGVNSDTKSF